MIHIYCGDGKGKTTAAVGLAVRAAGQGKQVLFVRFLKDLRSGEVAVLESLPQVTLLHPGKTFGFYHSLSEEEKSACDNVYRRLWEETQKAVRDGGYGFLILDEFMAAWRYGMIPREEAVSFLRAQREKQEIVLTGRDPAPEVSELADYISEIRKVRHPFDRGIAAREGVEY